MKLIADSGIPIRTISANTIQHDKYIVVDGGTTETGSSNFSQTGALSNSENVLVIWNDLRVAVSYLAYWQNHLARGLLVQ